MKDIKTTQTNKIMKRQTLTLSGIIVLISLVSCIFLSNKIDNNIRTVTETVTDTIRIVDTLEVEVIKKIYVKQKPHKEIDYIYLHSTRYDLSQRYAKARDLASQGTIQSIRLAKLEMIEAKRISKKFAEYKSHLIYVK